MVKLVGFSSLQGLIESTVPKDILYKGREDTVLPAPHSETEALAALKEIASANKVLAPSRVHGPLT
jgi:glycine cleavage system pyridoxal-binding protein P